MDTVHTKLHFVLCIHNNDAPDLEVRKAYPVIPSHPHEAGYLRIIDESGEDYLYPAEYFVLLDLPQQAEQALLHAA